MTDFHFLRPFWLLTLLPVFLLYWKSLGSKDLVDQWGESIAPHLLEHLLVGNHKKSWFRPTYLLLVVWILTVIALAGPSWQKEPSPFLSDEAGLMILLKVSETMESTDVQPSRLERAKLKLSDLMDLRKGASTGLIVYSGSAHLVMPLTRDDRIINSMLEELTSDLMPMEGDVLGQALQKAVNIFRQTAIPGSLLVVTDTVVPNQELVPEFYENILPVQFLSMQPTDAQLDPGLQKSAEALDASIIRLSIDRSDIEQVASRAKTELSNVTIHDKGERWRDNGYFLLFPIGICLLMWFRKGWVVQ